MLALSLLALAAPLVSAIQFTEPFANSTLKKGETYSVKWSSVDTDPTTFSIYLVNFVDWPPFYTQVASDVQTSEGVHQVTVPCDVSTSWGFQFNAINGTNVYVIHAQTPRFYVRDGACSGSAPVPPPQGASSTCKPVTVTETETVASTITVSASCSLSPSTSGLATASTASTTAVAESTHKPTSADATSGSLTAKPQPTGKPGSGGNGEDVDTDSGCSTEDSVPTSTASDAPAPPVVTAPPVVNNAHAGSGGTGTTSTVYSTVYRDLSEVPEECEQSCAAH